jgi:hypothetical protein
VDWLGNWQPSSNDKGGMEEKSQTGWVAIGCVGDSAPRQPLVVSGGSRTFVAMTTPPPERREARQTGLFVPRAAEGESPGHRGGQGPRWVESKPWRMSGCGPQQATGRENLLQGTGR